MTSNEHMRIEEEVLKRSLFTQDGDTILKDYVLRTPDNTYSDTDIDVFKSIMCSALVASKGIAIALASNQVRELVAYSNNNLRQLPRMFIYNTINEDYIYINPTIVWRSEETTVMDEGCMSVEGQWPKSRNKEIILEYQQEFNGRYVSKKLTGLDAIVAQHEVDHLNGKLISQKEIGK